MNTLLIRIFLSSIPAAKGCQKQTETRWGSRQSERDAKYHVMTLCYDVWQVFQVFTTKISTYQQCCKAQNQYCNAMTSRRRVQMLIWLQQTASVNALSDPDPLRCELFHCHLVWWPELVICITLWTSWIPGQRTVSAGQNIYISLL